MRDALAAIGYAGERRKPRAVDAYFEACTDGINHNEIDDGRANHLEADCSLLLELMLNAATKTRSIPA